MKLSVSVWGMTRARDGFTLIEVMVAVMIVSVVIGALWQMKGDATQKFFQFQKMTQNNQYMSFLLGNAQKYGFEKSNIDLRTLVDDFDLESNLRRQLKRVKIALSYDVLNAIDTNDSVILEIGKTKMHSKDFTHTLLRVRTQ